jgi:hypothetical protein
MSLVLVLGLGCVGAAFGSGPSSGASPSVAALLGDLACTGNSDCQTVPLADQACGGPRGWLAYSVRRTNKAALQRAVRQEAQAQPRNDRVSTCAVMADPGAICVPAAASAPGSPGQCRLAPTQGLMPLK